MVVGNGLLAKTFAHLELNDDKIIFASGVSNSSETSEAAFDREENLLREYLRLKGLLVYFSTISIFDDSLQETPYIKHKKRLEKMIRKEGSSFIIFRLPILVGLSTNPYTLTNFIYHRIKNGLPLKVFKNAQRYLMGVDDVGMHLSKMIDLNIYMNQSINIFYDIPIDIAGLVNIFEKILNKKALIESVEFGSYYRPDNRIFRSFLEGMNFEVSLNYVEMTINRYYRVPPF